MQKKKRSDKNKNNTLYINYLGLLKHHLMIYTGVVFIFNHWSISAVTGVMAPATNRQKGSYSACSCPMLSSVQHSSHFKL